MQHEEMPDAQVAGEAGPAQKPDFRCALVVFANMAPHCRECEGGHLCQHKGQSEAAQDAGARRRAEIGLPVAPDQPCDDHDAHHQDLHASAYEYPVHVEVERGREVVMRGLCLRRLEGDVAKLTENAAAIAITVICRTVPSPTVSLSREATSARVAKKMANEIENLKGLIQTGLPKISRGSGIAQIRVMNVAASANAVRSRKGVGGRCEKVSDKDIDGFPYVPVAEGGLVEKRGRGGSTRAKYPLVTLGRARDVMHPGNVKGKCYHWKYLDLRD